MKILLCLLVLSFGFVGCDTRTPEQVRRDEVRAQKTADEERRFKMDFRRKVLECEHKFIVNGDGIFNDRKIFCEKCGTDQKDLPRIK